MLKLIALIFIAGITFLFFPAALVVVAGIVLVGIVASLLFSAFGSVISFVGSTAASILGVAFTGLVVVCSVIALAFIAPMLLLVAIPLLLVLLLGSVFCSLVCGAL